MEPSRKRGEDIDLYAFVRNDPINGIDYLGLFDWLCFGNCMLIDDLRDLWELIENIKEGRMTRRQFLRALRPLLKKFLPVAIANTCWCVKKCWR